jgi:hypothetical protein
MGLFDWFRPAWKNSDSEIRRAAVAALGSEDLAVITDVLRADPAAAVRREALRKVDDLALLTEVAASDSDEELRGLAASRADELRLRAVLEATNEAEGKAAVAGLKTTKALVEVARKAVGKTVRKAALAAVTEQPALLELAQEASDPDIRSKAFARITEPKLLKHLALHEGVRELQLKAVERLEDLPSLETIAQRATVKAVRAAAAEKVRAKQPASAPKDEKKDGKAAERAAKERQSHKLAEIEAQRRREADEAREARARALREADGAARARAEAAAVPDEKQLEEQRLRAARKVEADAERAAQDAAHAADRAAREAARQKRDAERATQDAARAEEETRWIETIAPVVAKLESLVESEDRKALDEALKALREAPALRGRTGLAAEAMRKRLDEAKGKVSVRLNDLRDAESWRRWANVPKLEALIVKAEALLASTETDAKKILQDLKALQAEWKAVGGAPREKADVLWGRFKEIADNVYSRAQQGFAVLDTERVANLEKKKALIARAEAAAGSTEWKPTADLFKELQAEWKAIGPVPKEEADAIWQQFHTICDKFFAARKVVLGEQEADRMVNLTKLVALCEKAEALRASTEWKTTADSLKLLQAEWKTIGPAGKTRAEADEVWQRFRTACDGFFERRKAVYALEDEKRASNLKKKEAILARAEKLAEGDETPDPDHIIGGLMAEWKAVGHVPREVADDLWSRFRNACDKIRSPAPVDEEGAAAAMEAAAFSNRPLAAIAKKLQS